MLMNVCEMYAMATALVAGYNTLYGICILVIAIIDDLRQCMVNMDAQINANEAANWSAKKRLDVKMAFYEFIQLHADLKELATLF